MSVIKHFLLVFNHEVGEMVSLTEYGTDSNRALADYSKVEQEFKESPMMDIVLIGSDSLETVQLTHANYFDGSAAIISKYLSGI